MAEHTTTDNVKQLDHQLYELLEKYDGVFLGEYHDDPNMKQAVTYLMPALKAHGVGTICIEQEQVAIEAALHADSAEALRKKFPLMLDEPRATSLYDLVQAAKKYDMKILGYEKPDIRMMKILTKEKESQLSEEDKAYARSVMKNDVTREGIEGRDKYGADYIAKNKVGKCVVIGGLLHSRHLEVEAPDQYVGLSKLLGIPAVDVHCHIGWMFQGLTNTNITQPDAPKFTTAYPHNEAGSNFVVRMPSDIKAFMIPNIRGTYEGHSWPPPSLDIPLTPVSPDPFKSRQK